MQTHPEFSEKSSSVPSKVIIINYRNVFSEISGARACEILREIVCEISRKPIFAPFTLNV